MRTDNPTQTQRPLDERELSNKDAGTPFLLVATTEREREGRRALVYTRERDLTRHLAAIFEALRTVLEVAEPPVNRRALGLVDTAAETARKLADTAERHCRDQAWCAANKLADTCEGGLLTLPQRVREVLWHLEASARMTSTIFTLLALCGALNDQEIDLLAPDDIPPAASGLLYLANWLLDQQLDSVQADPLEVADAANWITSSPLRGIACGEPPAPAAHPLGGAA